MERLMSVPPKKPPVGRLLDVERLSEAERNSLKGDAARQGDEGLRQGAAGAGAMPNRGCQHEVDDRRPCRCRRAVNPQIEEEWRCASA